MKTLYTFLKFMVYSTIVNMAATLPAQDNPLFWKLFLYSLGAAALKAFVTYVTTRVKV